MSSCKNGFIKNGTTCISCFEKFSGCKNCSESQCLNCYTELNYKMNNNNNLCENGESNNLNNLNYDNKLEFKSFDSFEKANNKISFKSHFILLKNYLSKTNLIINGNIIYNNILLRFLRKLTSPEQIYCEQYGVSLGNSNNGGYLANYICSKEMTTNEIVSIEPITMDIKDKNNVTIQDFKFENKISIDKNLETNSLDEEYFNYKFNKITISKISNIKLKKELSFNINGDSDEIIDNENNYKIVLKNKDNKEIIAICSVPKTDTKNNINISCSSPINEINEKNDNLKIEQDIYKSFNNEQALILYNKNNVDINVKKESLSVGAIIGITIAGIIVIVPFVFYLVRYFIIKKDNNYENEGNENNGIRPPNVDNSRDIIFNHNYY